MVTTIQPIDEYSSKEEVYKDFGLFIYSSKFCVQIDEQNKQILIADGSKLDALISYAENFIFAINDLFGSGMKYFAIALDSMRKEMEREFCVPTERQFKAVIATIKAELRENFALVETPNSLIFTRVL